MAFRASMGCLVIAAALAAQAADWPQWRGPNRDGISAESDWQETWPEGGPKVLWKASVGRGLSCVAISQGRLYTLGSNGDYEVALCLDACTGKELWRNTYPARRNLAYPGPAATPTVDGGLVYTLGREGHLACYDGASGRIAWSRELREDFHVKLPNPDYGHSCSPLVVGRLLIVEVGAPEALVVAFEKANGRVAWKSGEGGVLAYSSPVAFDWDGKQRVAVFHAFGLGVFDPADGKELWRFPWKTYDRCSIATPIISDGRIFISAAYKAGSALLQPGSDQPVWRSKEMMCHMGTCVLWKGYLYGFHGDRTAAGELRCIELATGALKWSQGGMGKGSVLLAAGWLIVLSQKGELLTAEASPEGFQPTARAKVLGGLCWTMPVLCDGRLYCRNHEGDLVCLDLAGKVAEGGRRASE